MIFEEGNGKPNHTSHPLGHYSEKTCLWGSRLFFWQKANFGADG